jgi:general secretion pathway protein G
MDRRDADCGLYFNCEFKKVLKMKSFTKEACGALNVVNVKATRGFTLIEILIVIVIISILGALIVPRIMGRPDEARIIAARQDIASISQALKLYRLDNMRYPTTEQGLQSLVKKPTIAPEPANWKGNGYLERLPNDPWKYPYQYLQPGLHGDFDVMSLGADGAPGGEGNDADIGSWDL